MPPSKNRKPSAQPRIVHVARECAAVTAAGGVGDVVLQLGLECARQGFRTSIVLPHYGKFSRERLARLAERLAPIVPGCDSRPRFPLPVDMGIPMAYASHPRRAESIRLVTIDFRGPASLSLVFVVSGRFTGKGRPYTYTAEEARTIARAPPGAKSACGAELPPSGFPVAEGSGHFDYFAMNVLLQKAALAWMQRCGDPPLAVHSHDAHAAMLPMMAKHGAPASLRARTRFVVTAHNCGTAYRQRCADLDFVAAVSGLPLAAVRRCVIEGEFDPLGCAALHADALTTVSDGYAWEVQGARISTSGGDSEVRGFSEFLARHGVRLRGIVNGISPELKGPQAFLNEAGLARADTEDFRWKPAFRRQFALRISGAELPPEWSLRRDCRYGHLGGLPPGGCLFSFVGRWTEQKGVDILVRAASEVLDLHEDAGLCVLGEGNQPLLLGSLIELVEQFPGRVVVVQGFSHSLAASIYAAADFCLVPSRFEPCGLVDMIAQLNGNLPIVNQVGGLAKVVDGVSGIGYFARNDRANLRGLVDAMRRAIALRADPSAHTRMQRTAATTVRRKFAWSAVFRRFAPLYEAGAASEAPAASRDDIREDPGADRA